MVSPTALGGLLRSSRCENRQVDGEEGLTRQIEAGWGLSAVEVVEELVSYPTRKVLHLSTEHCDYAAKVFEPLALVDVRSGIETLLDVRRGGFAHAPELLATTSGSFIGTTTAGPMVIMEYLPTPLDESDRASTWTDLGSALARLNALTGNRPFAIPIGLALREQITRAEGTPFEAGVRQLAKRLAHLGSVSGTCVIHGEANPSNAARRATGELVLLDWDQAGAAANALDYGYPLVTCHISEALDVDENAVESFYDAYRASGGVVDVAMAFDAALFHALRYMWFANTEERWERIEFAVRTESDLADLMA